MNETKGQVRFSAELFGELLSQMCLIWSMSRSQFYTVLFFLLPLFYYLSLPIATGDLSVWVAHGRYMTENSKILYHDIFSVLKTTELVYPVLICYIYGLIDAVGGLELVSLFHKIVLIVMLYLIYNNSMKQHSYGWKNCLFILLSFAGFALYFTDRPAMVALLPVIIAYLIIEKAEDFKTKQILQLSLLLLIWVNIHGSWPILLVLFGWKALFLLRSHNILKYTGIGLLLSAVTLLNPFGYKVWPYLLETARISKQRSIDEWHVTNLYDYFPHAIIFYITCAILIFLVYKKVKYEKNWKIFSSPAFILMLMGFVAMRNVGLISLVLLPFLHKYGFLENSPITSARKSYLNVAIVGLLIVMCITQIPYFKTKLSGYLPNSKARVYDQSAAVEFVEYIKSSGKTGAILNDWEYGSHLLYSLKNPILVDARNIIYSQEDYIKYAQILEGGNYGWREAIAPYNFEFMLLDKKLRQKFSAELEASVDWVKVLENQDTVLFQRK